MIITDILLQKNKNGVYDIALDDAGNLVADTGYSNALLISFYTDARASAPEVSNSENRKGWWGDLFSDTGPQGIGSKLWLINTLPVSLDNMNAGIAYLQTAFSWLVREQRSTKIEVSGSLLESFGYRFDVTIFNGSDIITTKTFELWRDTVAT